MHKMKVDMTEVLLDKLNWAFEEPKKEVDQWRLDYIEWLEEHLEWAKQDEDEFLIKQFTKELEEQKAKLK